MVVGWRWLVIVASVTVHGNFNLPTCSPNHEWWSNQIVYQVYPMSFKDSDGDGVGDLRGIVQKLDHFVDLGVKILWIGPIFKSPMDDMGYDVEDYKMIDPVFGSMDDFKELISEMNKRNLKMITDLVPNHSSYKSEWFKKSIQREGKYTDYYMWYNATNQEEILKNPSVVPIPPNNWLGLFGGSGWTWNTERNQFYYHQFSSKQPDFNIRNPDVQLEILDILTFWMDLGVAGFRFDALKHLYESANLTDEKYYPGKENSTNYDDMIHDCTQDQPENIEIIYSWRKFMDNYVKEKNESLPRIMVTESYSAIDTLMKYYGNEKNPGAQIPMNLKIVQMGRDNIVNEVDQLISDWLGSMPKNMEANWVIENHDNPRIPDRYGPESVPLFTALKLVLPGIDVTYYGSEIGMPNTYVRPDQIKDPNNAGGKMADAVRDNERCPMQWDDSTNAGFTDAKKPWLPVNPNYYELNVETQKKNPNSNYNFYKKMSELRSTETLKHGGLQTFNVSKSIYIVKRFLAEHESYFVVMNFGSETETIVLSSVLGNIKDKLYVYLGSVNSAYTQGSAVYLNGSNGSLKLRPQSVVVLTDKVITNNSLSSSGRSNTQTSLKLITLFCILFCIQILFS